MFQSWLRFLPILVLTLLAPGWAPAQETAPATAGTAEAELREAIRVYDDALRRADVATAEQFWAAEYVFINPRATWTETWRYTPCS